MDPRWLEVVLRKKAEDESPVKVIECETIQHVIPKGDNYLSTIERVRAKVLVGSGKIKNISMILKKQHNTENMKQFSIKTGVFVKEIYMYRDVLPKMEELLEAAGDYEGIFWAQCYDVRLYDQLLLEDLKMAGYRMADRKKQLGLQSTLLVVKHLAKFHALARVLMDRGEIPLELFKNFNFVTVPEIIIHGTRNNMKHLTQAMETWGDEWRDPIDRIRAVQDGLGQRFLDLIVAQEGEFTTLCYGDCWTNNMMFRGEDIENPISMKFVDLQLSFISCPATDLQYFFNTSVRLDVLNNRIDQLIERYHESLVAFLGQFGYKGSMPSLVDFQVSMRRRDIFHLINSHLLTYVTKNEEDVEDIEETMKREMDTISGEDTPSANPFENISELTKTLIQASIKRVVDSNAI